MSREHTEGNASPSSSPQPETVDVTPTSSSPDSGAAERAVTMARRPADALAEFGLDDVGLERALKLANQIGGLIREKALAVDIRGREHIKVEGWCALGALVGVTPKTEHVAEERNPQTGSIEGYVATVVAIRVETGATVGRAMAGCFFDEQERRRDGTYYDRWLSDTGRPIRHAAMSMAQTRATSKCLGQVLRFIPVMAGFSGTPFEEMAGFAEETQGSQRPPQGARSNSGSRPAQAQKAKAKPDDPISVPQQRRLWGKARDKEREIADESIPASAIVKYVFSQFGVSETASIKRSEYEAICKAVDDFQPGPPPDNPDSPQAEVFD